MHRHLQAIALLLLLYSNILAAKETTVLVIGDSLSAAYGLEIEQGWVAILAAELDRQGQGIRFVNASVSGDTSANAKQRLPALLLRHQPDIVILEIGGNDGLRGLSLAALRKNISALLEATIAYPSQVLLLGIQLPPNYGLAYSRRFRQLYQQLSEQYKVPLQGDFLHDVGGVADHMQDDDIHPNARGQQILARNVCQALTPLLRVTKQRPLHCPQANP